MKNILELDGSLQAPINDDGDELAEHFHKAYSMLLTYALRDKYDGSLRALRCQPPVAKTRCIILTTICHIEGSGFSSSCTNASQLFMCYAHIRDVPPNRFGKIRLMAHSIFYSARTPSAT